MTRLRLFLFLLTILVVGILGFFVSLYARGYRFDKKSLKFTPNGILVVKSVPDGAQILINGELKGATNTTTSLSPGNSDLTIRKEGYYVWNKRVGIQKEAVTEVTAYLFKNVPSLSAVTFTGVISPVPAFDFSKIAYAIPPVVDNSGNAKNGLWIIENVSFPLGFAQGPKQITDGDFSQGASWIFSPDARQILLTTSKGIYLLDTGSFTPQSSRPNVSARSKEILAAWEKEAKNRLNEKIKNLPEPFTEILRNDAENIIFSPDENKILYTASTSAEISENLIKPMPGASSQKQDRNIKEGKTYVYDIKEDRNFYLADAPNNLFWFPNSLNLVLPEEGKITILDYDGTNGQVVYNGSYLAPHAFPFASADRLLVLTNLGSNSTFPNLYSISLR